MKVVAHIVLFAFFAWTACVEVVEFGVPAPPDGLPLIVEGSFTSGDTAYVALSKAYPVDGVYHPTRIVGAKVAILDKDDATFRLDLQQPRPPIFGTVGWKGDLYNGSLYIADRAIEPEFGHQYYLKVELAGGQRFESTPQQALDTGTIDRVYFELTERFNREKNSREEGFNVFVDSHFLQEDERYIRWKVRGTYRILGDRSMCWITEREDKPILSNARTANGMNVQRVFVKYIPITYKTFNDRYYIEVIQQSVSRDVWQFYDAVRYQLENASNLFQPPFPSMPGNMAPIGHNSPVIGIFSVSLDVRRGRFISTRDLPHPITGILEPIDCSLIPNSSTTPPTFWK